MSDLEFAAFHYRAVRDRLRTIDPDLDEKTLADTVEGLTALPDIIEAIIRSALTDEALAAGLKIRITDMQSRLDRLADRASKRRQIAKDVMIEAEIKRITAPDFTVSVRQGSPALIVIDETAIPTAFLVPQKPRVDRAGLLAELKGGVEIAGAQLSNPEPVLSIRVR
jgi:hypothetical protein